MHDKKVKPRLEAAKEEDDRCKERRNPSADAHVEPMSDGEALAIVPSWARAIRYRPPLRHRLSLTFFACTPAPFPRRLSLEAEQVSPIFRPDHQIMSATAMLQLKQQLSKLSDKERQEVAAFLHRLKQETPAWQKEMAHRMAEMDAGKKFRLPKASSRS